MALNNLISITFTSQPNDGDTISFDYIVGMTAGNASAIYNTDITIGATLTDTIQNTLDYFVAIFGVDINPSNITSYIVGNIGYIKIEGIEVNFLNFEDEPERFTISISNYVSLTKINIRSPYYITVDEVDQEGSKIELFFWNKGTSVPTIAQYQLSKPVVSSIQRANNYNISEFAKEYIKPVAPVFSSSVVEENVNMWCYMRVKRYKLESGSYTLLDTEDFVCLNGFNLYQDGYNLSSNETVLDLRNDNIVLQIKDESSAYYNVFLEAGTYSNVFGSFSIPERSMYKIPLKQFPTQLNFEVVCDAIYTPMVCTFINRFGGWQYLTLFKAKTNSFESSSSDYNLLQNSINYNIQQGQKQKFNFRLKQKVKANTGFVPENYSELIQDLIVSETILLDGKPATLITQSFEEKTHLKDNNINYELEFEYNYNLINDVV